MHKVDKEGLIETLLVVSCTCWLAYESILLFVEIITKAVRG